MAERTWAFWRRFQYGAGFSIFFTLIGIGCYFIWFYAPPTCFDGVQNGEERGVDCGGACVRICAFDVTQPSVNWARAFRVTEGQYNAVAYIENRNPVAATPEIAYTFELYDAAGLITSVDGTTILPPNSVYPIFEPRIFTGDRVPTQTFLTLGDATLWLPADAGREQFVVQSRELFDADARPRLEAVLSNTALTDAFDVEVVATIFDAQGNALTSSRTFVDEFAGRAEETAIFTWPEPIAKTIRSCEVPTDVVLAIDLSGSMNDDQDDPPEPISSVLRAASTFANRLQTGDQASVVTFATEAAVARELTGNTGTVAAFISELSIPPAEEVGSTNTGDALYRAGEELTSTRHNDEARKVLVILTDGLATAPREEPEQYALEASAWVKEQGVEVYAIGLGDGVNMEFVEQVASRPDAAYEALTLAEVDTIYESITASICEEGAAIIDIIPKTDTTFAPLQ